jgi:hypothetical protein
MTDGMRAVEVSSETAREEATSMSPIDETEFARILARGGLNLTPEQVRDVLPGANLLLGMITRAQTSMPREVEPALTFNVEQG